MVRVFLRHAATEYNETNRWLGKTNQKLSPKGLVQAQQVAKELAVYRFDVIYSSPLSRAIQTAELVAASQINSCRIQVLSDLAERGFGDLEGRVKCESDRRSLDQLPTVEPALDFERRLQRVWTAVNPDLENILFVSHSTVFSRMLAMGMIRSESGRNRLENAEYSLLLSIPI
ncbi:MAG: histidine phosphatase family protein [Pseudohongiella sp.]|nr:histidine phosphatase family protein [Pseudohongiella sp.]MDP2286032.1 histidine phosphatase family protein [Pseudohongiella sp.]